MVRNQQLLHFNIEETIRLRREADRLLARLEADRQTSEQVNAEIGKHDAMRSITGRSAIERAIDMTRGMIRDMDHLLEEAAEQLGGLDNGVNGQHETHHDRRNSGICEAHLVESS
jgi:hypothetical protein